MNNMQPCRDEMSNFLHLKSPMVSVILMVAVVEMASLCP